MLKFKIIIFNAYYNYKIIVLRIRGAKIGDNVKIYGKVVVKYPSKLVIGNNTTINDGVLLNCRGGITIGNGCRISSSVKIHSTGLTINEIPRYHISDMIILKDNIWIGSSSVITKGVIIGENSVISALSLVNKNLDSNYVYGGVPVKKLKIVNQVII